MRSCCLFSSFDSEKIGQSGCDEVESGIYPDRVAGRYRHYSCSGGHAASRHGQGKTIGEGRRLPRSLLADRFISSGLPFRQ